MTHAELERQLDLALAQDDLLDKSKLSPARRVVLTRVLIDKCRTDRGAFTNATLIALGITKATLIRGWPDRLIGKSISAEAYQRAVAGRTMYSTGPLPSY